MADAKHIRAAFGVARREERLTRYPVLRPELLKELFGVADQPSFGILQSLANSLASIGLGILDHGPRLTVDR
jgi:hypothetical protein